MASVTLREVRKSFGDVQVVRGVDLDIRDGEFLVLVGASGCGKSTLLRMLAGLETPTSGEVCIDGAVVNDMRPQDRDIAMVFQSYALYPHMTVRENMAFGLKVRKRPQSEIDKAVNEAADMLGLGALLDRFPKEMSGGQRQRVAMGRAIVRRPKVFLFDEPLSNLDAALRAEMRVELKKLHGELGVTMIYVTHDQVEAMTMADRIALLDKGVVAHCGPPRELYDWPRNRYTASFLGSPPMSFFEAEIQSGVVDAPGVRLPVAPANVATMPTGRVCVGVRPHDLHLEGQEGWGSVEVSVDVIEPMGWEAHVHVQSDSIRGVARVEADQAESLRPGSRLTLRVRPEDVRLFDIDTGLALCGAPAG